MREFGLKTKKNKRQQDIRIASHAARQKFNDNKKLTRKDMVLLIRENQVRGDSPLRKSIEDIRSQFERRMHRTHGTYAEVISTETQTPPAHDDSILVASILEGISNISEVAEL